VCCVYVWEKFYTDVMKLWIATKIINAFDDFAALFPKPA